MGLAWRWHGQYLQQNCSAPPSHQPRSDHLIRVGGATGRLRSDRLARDVRPSHRDWSVSPRRFTKSKSMNWSGVSCATVTAVPRLMSVFDPRSPTDHNADKKAGISAALTVSGLSTSRPSALAARTRRWSEAASTLTPNGRSKSACRRKACNMAPSVEFKLWRLTNSMPSRMSSNSRPRTKKSGC